MFDFTSHYPEAVKSFSDSIGLRFDSRVFAKVLTNALEDLGEVSETQRTVRLCDDVRAVSYEATFAIDTVMQKHKSLSGPRARLAAQVCERCVSWQTCESFVAAANMPATPNDVLVDFALREGIITERSGLDAELLSPPSTRVAQLDAISRKAHPSRPSREERV